MENVQKEKITLAERIRRLEDDKKLSDRKLTTKKKQKKFKYPFKWSSKMRQTNKKQNSEKILVFYLNKKNEIEPPRFMPIFDGNMVVWRNKPYEFDPRAVWTVKGIPKNPKAYLIKEIDRRPVSNHRGKYLYADSAVSNMDLEDIRERGDSTESDEFLIKAALKAQKQEMKKNVGKGVLVVVGLIVVGVVIWLLAG